MPPPPDLRVDFIRFLHDHAISDPLDALRMSWWLHDMIHDLRALAITQARFHGTSWRDIAAHLGEPPGSVHRRYKHLDPPDPASV